MFLRARLTAKAAAVVAVVALAGLLIESTAMAQHPFPKRLQVAPFPTDLAWLNTSKSIKLEDLKGKFVLLDFWTYCCINCMHILPELKKLEKAYPNNLVVIGVHSAKFDAEHGTKNVAEAILRYEIEHPVVNDPEHVLWNRLGVQAWPTLLLIDPEGQAVWGQRGESTFEQVDVILKRALPYYRNARLLNETPLQFDLEAHRAAKTPLRFPGKILADEPGGRIFIADSGHNRIVIARPDGTLIETIGAGTLGQADGDYSTAQFNAPQGMALDGNNLYVADTQNHLIRKVDLAGSKVETVAGTGKQLRGLNELDLRGPPLRTAIASPWALYVHGDRLYIAMAGTHQIWWMALDGSRIRPYAGNGSEDIVDGPLLPSRPYQPGFSSFAQPSGLASDGTWLYVADSEGSSIRKVPLDPRRKVDTLVGTAHLKDGRLFTFGDVDGPRLRAQLQHVLGVVYHADNLYVADTYNNKIKVIDPTKAVTQTIAGTGQPGAGDDPAAFDEPAGLTAIDGKLFVADTNNHLIRVIDLAQDNRVSTLSIEGLTPPEVGEP